MSLELFLIAVLPFATAALIFIRIGRIRRRSTEDTRDKTQAARIAELVETVQSASSADELRMWIGQLEAQPDYALLSGSYFIIVQLGRAIEAALRVNELSDFARCAWPKLPDDEPEQFPPTLRAAVDALRELTATMDHGIEITAPLNLANTLLEVNEQLVLLTRAQYELKDLRGGFGPLVARVVSHWADVLKREGERLREARTHIPIPNPYVIGNPVRAPLFVGREDVMRRLTELWASEGQCPSVVVYGHRRMGKSSVLQNLGTLRMPQRTIIVDFNLQRIGRVQSTGELLFSLALKLYDVASAAGLGLGGGLVEPVNSDYLGEGKNPYLSFDRFLGRLGLLRDGHRFLVTVDEFELFEEQIAEGRLEAHLLAAFRATFQTYPWFMMAFAGLHRLEELRHDYWNPLFGSVSAVEVGFLSEGAARLLITQPSPDFNIDYDAGALHRIYELTHGQPYLVQLICHSLVARYNRQLLEESHPPPRRFTQSDVDVVIATAELFRDGTRYFQGVWDHAERGAPPGQTTVLRVLAEHAQGQSLEELAAKCELGSERTLVALRTLLRHAVIEERDGRFLFTVELLRRWVLGRA